MLLTIAVLLTVVRAEYYYDKDVNIEEHYYKNTDTDHEPIQTTAIEEDDNEPTETKAVGEDDEVENITRSTLRTLNHQELIDVQNALKMLMHNSEVKDKLFTTTDAEAQASGVTDVLTSWQKGADVAAVTDVPTTVDAVTDIPTGADAVTEVPTGADAVTDVPTGADAVTDTSWQTDNTDLLLNLLENLDITNDTEVKDAPTPTRSSTILKPTRRVQGSTASDVNVWVPVDLRMGRDNPGVDTKTDYESGDKTTLDTTNVIDSEETVLAQNESLFETEMDPLSTTAFAGEVLALNDSSDRTKMKKFGTTALSKDGRVLTTTRMKAVDNVLEYFEEINRLDSKTIEENKDIERNFGIDSVRRKLPHIARQNEPSSTETSTGETGSEETDSDFNQFSSKNITTTTTTTTIATTTTRSRRRKTKTRKPLRRKTTRTFTYSSTTSKTRRKKTRTRSTTPTTTTTPIMLDIPRLMELITNLTMDYSMNLTNLVNKTLQDVAMFTCPTGTTTTEPPTSTLTTTEDPYGNLTGTIMAKCFVCGLDTPTMPRHAQCADAFSGDFIPLVPVEATARKKLASYRKYCRWMNVPKYIINETDSRSMWGRWTGGCSVRWVDVTGIYTQRTCRNRHRAIMGLHWASKRMAKLEMALQRLENGCIISPMASLIPLSRGLSLYARFHACVCTGSWCNRASRNPQCMMLVVKTLLLVLFFIVT